MFFTFIVVVVSTLPLSSRKLLLCRIGVRGGTPSPWKNETFKLFSCNKILYSINLVQDIYNVLNYIF